MDEVLAVSRAAAPFWRASMIANLEWPQRWKPGTQMTDVFSPTAQDLNRGHPTEIDALNGYISRRGAELGIPVPVNHALFTLVKLAEQTGII